MSVFVYAQGYPIVEISQYINIASGSEANITTSCEMKIFNFLWHIWDHYLVGSTYS